MTPFNSSTCSKSQTILLPLGEERTKPFWLNEKDEKIAKLQTIKQLPISSELNPIDICVIGSGISGSMVVHRLTKQIENLQNPPSILLLEAQNLCEGATARNGGHCKPLTYLGFRKDIEKYGSKLANDQFVFEFSHLKTYIDLIKEEDIDCDFHLTRAYDIYFDKKDSEEARKDFIERKRLFPEQVKKEDLQEICNKTQIENVTGVKGGIWAIHYPAGHLWPYKLTTQLILNSIKRSKGKLNVLTQTPVLEIKQIHEKSIYEIKTDKGLLYTKIVIVCTNAWTSGILPSFKEKIIPIRGTVCAIHPSKNHQLGAEAKGQKGRLINTYMLRFGPAMYEYMIVRQGRGRITGFGDQSIILGGARKVYNHDLNQWYNQNDDSKLISGTFDYFKGYMSKYFKGWILNSNNQDDKNGKLFSIWTGILGYSNDLLPYVGKIQKGLYISAGFTGHGMPRIPKCSFALADLALSELFSNNFEPSKEAQDQFDQTIPKTYHYSPERLAKDINLILPSDEDSNPFSPKKPKSRQSLLIIM